jgi:hypothetical protein
LQYFDDYFPKTALIVGLQHPVRWFESYYNFRFRHIREGKTLPEADQPIGECTAAAQGVCTDYAKFHVNLACQPCFLLQAVRKLDALLTPWSF